MSVHYDYYFEQKPMQRQSLLRDDIGFGGGWPLNNILLFSTL